MSKQPTAKWIHGDKVMEQKKDGSFIEKDYKHVQDGYNGLYKNPQHTNLKDYAHEQSHKLAQQYYAHHSGGGSSSGNSPSSQQQIKSEYHQGGGGGNSYTSHRQDNNSYSQQPQQVQSQDRGYYGYAGNYVPYTEEDMSSRSSQSGNYRGGNNSYDRQDGTDYKPYTGPYRNNSAYY